MELKGRTDPQGPGWFFHGTNFDVSFLPWSARENMWNASVTFNIDRGLDNKLYITYDTSEFPNEYKEKVKFLIDGPNLYMSLYDIQENVTGNVLVGSRMRVRIALDMRDIRKLLDFFMSRIGVYREQQVDGTWRTSDRIERIHEAAADLGQIARVSRDMQSGRDSQDAAMRIVMQNMYGSAVRPLVGDRGFDSTDTQSMLQALRHARAFGTSRAEGEGPNGEPFLRGGLRRRTTRRSTKRRSSPKRNKRRTVRSRRT